MAEFSLLVGVASITVERAIRAWPKKHLIDREEVIVATGTSSRKRKRNPRSVVDHFKYPAFSWVPYR